jgi:hypothetical protein
LVATSADPGAVRVVEAFVKCRHLAYVGHEVARDLYRTHTTPFAYLLDPEAVVRDKGIPLDAGRMSKFFDQMTRSTRTDSKRSRAPTTA